MVLEEKEEEGELLKDIIKAGQRKQ